MTMLVTPQNGSSFKPSTTGSFLSSSLPVAFQSQLHCKMMMMMIPQCHGTRIRETDARVFSSGGYTEEKFEKEEILLAKENAECCFLSPSIPELSGQQQPEACSIEKIEQRAKASLEKLRNILYAVKTRTPDPSTLPSEYHDSYEQGQGRTQSKNWSKTLELEDFSNDRSKVPEEYLLKEAFVQDDTVTSTSSTVKFREETNTTMVTLTAAVRGNPSAKGDEKANQKSVILAAHALSQMCISLEEKAKVLLAISVKKPSVEVALGCSGRDPLSEVGPCSAARKHSLEVALGNLSRDSQIEHEHACILEQLRTGEVAEAFEIKKGYGATSFRPVYVVKLSQTDGLLSPALFKPFNPGDASRYKRASVEWIAYKLGQLLETDMVPPAVMRTKLQIGGRMFALGTMLHYVPDIRTLTHEGPKEWGAESPLHFVSNANILDALVGNAPRDCRLFAEGLHWVHWGQRRPMLLDHPRSAPDNSKPRSIWTPGVINFKGLRKVSARTLAALKCLDFSILHENLGSHLSVKELDEILHRRDHVVMCCESTQRTSASSEA